MESATPAHPNDDAGWRLEWLAKRIAGVIHAAVVSRDGRCAARTADMSTDIAERMAAITAGIIDLVCAGSRCLGSASIRQMIIQLADDGLLCIVLLDNTEHLVVLAAAADHEQLAFDVCRLVEHLNQIAPAPLTPGAVPSTCVSAVIDQSAIADECRDLITEGA